MKKDSDFYLKTYFLLIPYLGLVTSLIMFYISLFKVKKVLGFFKTWIIFCLTCISGFIFIISIRIIDYAGYLNDTGRIISYISSLYIFEIIILTVINKINKPIIKNYDIDKKLN